MAIAPETVLRGHSGEVQCLSFGDQDTVLLSGDSFGSVRVWNMDSARSQPTHAHNEDSGVTQVYLVSDAVLTQGRDGAVKQWRLGQDGSLLAPRDVVLPGCYHYCKFAVPRASQRGLSSDIGQNVIALAGEDNKGVKIVDWRAAEECLSICGSEQHGMTMCIEIPGTEQPLILVGRASTVHCCSFFCG
jgi:WD40 repeat protein